MWFTKNYSPIVLIDVIVEDIQDVVEAVKKCDGFNEEIQNITYVKEKKYEY